MRPPFLKGEFKMSCNCNCLNEDNTIKFVAGTSCDLSFDFDEDISSYTSAEFVIRANYAASPVINKTLTGLSGTTLEVNLTPSDTAQFTEFQNGKNSATYIWGLDLIDSAQDIRINVFPQTGEPAPLCIVYKHV